MQLRENFESLLIKISSLFSTPSKLIATIASHILVPLLAGILLTSCALEQGMGHTQSFRFPIFSSYPTSRTFYKDQNPDNANQNALSLLPIVGWETKELSSEDNTFSFDFFDTTVTGTVDVQEDSVVFNGGNENISLNFAVYDDDRFSYKGIILSEKDSGANETHWILFESILEGTITENFVSGTDGIAKAWVVTPRFSLSDTEPAEDTGSLTYLTYEVGVDDEVPYFTVSTFDETAPDASYYENPENITIADWEDKNEMFDAAFDATNLTQAVLPTLYLSDGSWDSPD